MINEPRFVTLLGATGQIRTATHDDREWTVVPVVALVEGVIHAVNAPWPELVRSGLFPKALAKWEGKPIFSGHPMRDGVPIDGLLPDVLPTSFGLVRNATANAKALQMEAWLDHARCGEGTPGARILERVRAVPPKPVEVSVGAWTYMKANEGTWTNGKRYAGEWVDWEPNHLALLVDQRGACDLEMGCGTHRVAMRVAADGQSLELEEAVSDHKGLFQRVLAFFRSAMPRGWGDDEVKQELREALEALEPVLLTNGGEILRVKNDVVVYCLYPPANYYGAPHLSKMTYWTRGYTFNTETQKFVVDVERTQVEPTTHYEPYRAAGESQEQLEPTLTAACSCGNDAATAAGEISMTKAERIAALVTNPHSPIKDAVELGKLEDATLTALEASTAALKAASEAPKPTPAAATEATPAATVAATAATPAAPAPVVADESEDEFLAKRPSIKAIVDGHRAAQAAKKVALVASIRAASQLLTEEQLNAKSIEDLEVFAALAKVEAPAPAVDYSLRGIPRAASSASDLASFAAPDPYAQPATH